MIFEASAWSTMCYDCSLFCGSFSYTSVIILIKYYKEGEDVYQITPNLRRMIWTFPSAMLANQSNGELHYKYATLSFKFYCLLIVSKCLSYSFCRISMFYF